MLTTIQVITQYLSNLIRNSQLPGWSIDSRASSAEITPAISLSKTKSTPWRHATSIAEVSAGWCVLDVQSLIHILATTKFTTLITWASGCNTRPRPRYAFMHRWLGDVRSYNLPAATVRQAETISSIWVKLRPLFACRRPCTPARPREAERSRLAKRISSWHCRESK